MSALRLVRCDQGSTGWSLHAPDATDEAIRNGDAYALVTGIGTPDTEDYAMAHRILKRRETLARRKA